MQVQSNNATPIQNNAATKTEKNGVAPQKEVKSEKVKNAASGKGETEKSEQVSAKTGVEEKTSVYLKVLSRLEGMAQKGDVPEKAAEGFTQALKTRIGEISEQDRKSVMLLAEMKPLNLKSLDELAEKVKEALQQKDPQKLETVLKLLKNSKFVELMDGKADQAPKTYSRPPGAPAAAPKMDEATSQPPPDLPLPSSEVAHDMPVSPPDTTAAASVNRPPLVSGDPEAVANAA